MSRLYLINVTSAAAAAVAVAVASLIGGAHGYRLVQRQDTGTQVPPTLFFDTIQNLTTCSTGIEFTWFYTGADALMALTVTNLGVPQQPEASGASPVNKTLSVDIVPLASTFVWGRVDVPPGNYRLAATIPTLGFIQQSAVFHVVLGRDTSCLPEPLPQPSSPGSTSQSQSTNTLPPSSSSPKPSDTVLPVAGATQPVSTGTIVGIVVGVGAMLILALATYFLLYRKKNKGWRAQGGAKMGSRKWNGLNSADSRRGLADAFGPSPPPLPSSPTRSRRLSSAQRWNDHGQHSTGGVGVSSVDEVEGATGFEEKFAGGRYSRKDSAATTYEEHDNGMVLANLPTLHHQQQGHALSSARGGVSGRRSSYSGPLGSAVADRSTRQDVEQHNPHIQPHSISRSASTTTSAATHQSGAVVVVSQDPKKAHRNSVGGRKRKPPPVYDPNEDAALPATGVSVPEVSPFQTPPSMSSPFQMDPESSADLHSHQSHQSGVGHYATRHVVVASSQPPEGGEGLVHKSSFGQGGVNDGKPVHYLIPDMPAGSTRKR